MLVATKAKMSDSEKPNWFHSSSVIWIPQKNPLARRVNNRIHWPDSKIH